MRLEIVNPATLIPHITDLLASNWSETGFDFPFNPDVSAYERMHELGICFAVAAIDGESVVGYCSVFVTKHPHSKDILIAGNDALFISQNHRNTLLAGRIIKEAEKEAKRRGANRFIWHCRWGTPLANTFKDHGYSPIDETVMKGL